MGTEMVVAIVTHRLPNHLVRAPRKIKTKSRREMEMKVMGMIQI